MSHQVDGQLSAVVHDSLCNFAAYPPNDNLPAAFVGSHIMCDGQFANDLTAQLKYSRLNTPIQLTRLPSMFFASISLALTGIYALAATLRM